jgi:hypothetical protein
MSERDPLQVLNDPFYELEDALSFPVSPDFCARVREQVAVEPSRRRTSGARWLALAAAVILAAVTGLITSLRDVGVDVAQVSASRIGTTQGPVPVEQEPAILIEPVRIPRRFAPVTARAPVAQFDTVVPGDQLRALDRLLASMRAGTATVPPAVADMELNDRGDRVLKAVVIEPVTVELLAGTPAEPNKNPVGNPNK